MNTRMIKSILININKIHLNNIVLLSLIHKQIKFSFKKINNKFTKKMKKSKMMIVGFLIRIKRKKRINNLKAQIKIINNRLMRMN